MNLKIGQIPVTRENDILWMRQKPPVFGKILESNRIAQVLNIDEGDIDQFSIQEVSTGLPFIVAPLKSLDALKRVQIDKEK